MLFVFNVIQAAHNQDETSVFCLTILVTVHIGRDNTVRTRQQWVNDDIKAINICMKCCYKQIAFTGNLLSHLSIENSLFTHVQLLCLMFFGLFMNWI